jgi:hypothetical protein
VTLPLASVKRLSWGAAVAAVLTALLTGELIFLGSQGTGFARWSARGVRRKLGAAARVKAEWDPTNFFRHNQNIPPAASAG